MTNDREFIWVAPTFSTINENNQADYIEQNYGERLKSVVNIDVDSINFITMGHLFAYQLGIHLTVQMLLEEICQSLV